MTISWAAFLISAAIGAPLLVVIILRPYPPGIRWYTRTVPLILAAIFVNYPATEHYHTLMSVDGEADDRKETRETLSLARLRMRSSPAHRPALRKNAHGTTANHRADTTFLRVR